MQANKATPEVMKDLRQWLEAPKTSAAASVDGAKDDLKWLNRQKDLSVVNLGEKVEPETTAATTTKDGGASTPTSAGAGFAALFGCVGKRK